MIRPAKTVAAIHDLSGVGRCALTVVLPVLSAMGAQACPVPTAVLSAHTAFSGIAVHDLTDFLPAYLAHWQALGLRFDAVYAGYLASPRQAEIVADFLDAQARALKVLDPVMGDDGALYSGMPSSMPEKWRALCARADVVTPNMTEYALLTGEDYSLAPRTAAQAARMLDALLDMGAQSAVITSVPLKTGPANIYMRKGDKEAGVCPFERLDICSPACSPARFCRATVLRARFWPPPLSPAAPWRAPCFCPRRSTTAWTWNRCFPCCGTTGI